MYDIGDLVLVREKSGNRGHYFGFLAQKDAEFLDLSIPIIDRYNHEGITTYRLYYDSCMKIDLNYIFNCSINIYVQAWFEKNLKTIEQGLTSKYKIVRDWAKKNLSI